MVIIFKTFVQHFHFFQDFRKQFTFVMPLTNMMTPWCICHASDI